MLRSLRSRLILSHVLPVVLVLPLMGFALVYVLESQFLIPKLAQNLAGNSRLLSEISGAEYELWGNPILFENLISRVKMDPAIEVMFLNPKGQLLFSSDAADEAKLGLLVISPGVDSALRGKESVLTNYSIFEVRDVLIDVYEPVTDAGDNVLGIVRLTYRVESLYETFGEMRWEILLVVILGMLISALVGYILAVNLNKPINRVTQAINDLAVGKRTEPLEIKSPEELHSQAVAVNFLVDELHSLEKSRKQLLANLVHELGRPLGAIRSATHALQNGAEKDAVLYADLTQGIEDETVRLEHLLNDLSDLYDQSLGDMELNEQPVEMEHWLCGVIRPWQSEAEEKGIAFQDQISPDLQLVWIDSDRFAQVVGNILSNAIKYTRPGGLIQISASEKEGMLTISIRDTGTGIQPNELEKVLQPFYRGEQGRKIKQGMGLGLTIANDITRAHHGELSIQSQPGKGTEVKIRIPIQPETLENT